MKKIALTVAAATSIFSLTSFAQANDTYITVSGALAERSTSENSGEFTSPFTTGAGTTIPAGTVLAAGTPLAWDTEFDSGYSFAGAIGMAFDSGFRGELEVRYISNNVSTHTGVAVGGGAIGSEDAGVLITGSANLGASVAAIVADGQGDSDTWAFMANAYYDFNKDGTISPYLGAGIGYASTNTVFSPSGVGVADTDNSGLAYQGIAGINYNVSESWGVFLDYRYFVSDAEETELSLLPATLDVENTAHLVSLGFRFNF